MKTNYVQVNNTSINFVTPWDYPQRWHNGCYDGNKIIWETKEIIVTDYIKQKYLSPAWYLDRLIEHWVYIEAIALFVSDGSKVSREELSKALSIKLSAVSDAVELGFSIGWFEVSEKVSLIFLEETGNEKCDSLMCVQELVPVLELPDSAQVGNSLESVKLNNTVQTSSTNDSPVSITTETCGVYQSEISKNRELKYSQLHHPVNRSQLTVKDSVQLMNEIVSQQCLMRSPTSTPNSFVSKTLPDCSPALTTQDNNQGHILGMWSKPLTASGTMRNGFVYVQDSLQPLSLENDYFWLESPGALSSTGNGRPPGQTKLETQLKKLGLLQKGEVLNPVILSKWYDIPPSWLDPWESRPATALLENKDRQQEIFSTPELERSPSPESNTSQHLQGNTEKFLEENSITEESGKETPTTEKFLEETLSTDNSRACGCLYQYIENKKLKNGSIASYPRVDGERDKHNYAHWRWGYSWEEKIDGDWKNRSVGVPTKIAHAVAEMIDKRSSVPEIREFITLSKNPKKADK
ncbi:hypothetical protein DSM107003_47490 [Trichormus variabilis SAG 1403-4b]|uniref:Uncharacterized protein n=1 Tax=Trichormus variabilis SAG 1403-4b TaxID=447716 RepID=A0A3S1BWU3_ANAVA|nr:hypothetical protein DSM107003_47490 [Trichormus variabilis SAG 1403-4b]